MIALPVTFTVIGLVGLMMMRASNHMQATRIEAVAGKAERPDRRACDRRPHARDSATGVDI